MVVIPARTIKSDEENYACTHCSGYFDVFSMPVKLPTFLQYLDDWEAANREEEQAMCTCLSRETILSLRIAGGLRYIKTGLITIDTSIYIVLLNFHLIAYFLLQLQSRWFYWAWATSFESPWCGLLGEVFSQNLLLSVALWEEQQ